MKLRRETTLVFAHSRPAALRVGRLLVASGLRDVRAAEDLISLRRALVRGTLARRTALCISLDDETLLRHGDGLARLLADRASFAVELRSLGLLAHAGPSRLAAEVGCDAYVDNTVLARRVVRHWFGRSTRREPIAIATADRPGSAYSPSVRSRDFVLDHPRFTLTPNARGTTSDKERSD